MKTLLKILDVRTLTVPQYVLLAVSGFSLGYVATWVVVSVLKKVAR